MSVEEEKKSSAAVGGVGGVGGCPFGKIGGDDDADDEKVYGDDVDEKKNKTTIKVIVCGENYTIARGSTILDLKHRLLTKINVKRHRHKNGPDNIKMRIRKLAASPVSCGRVCSCE
jgi:hypothetical protein